jgi:hypothetical protein
METENTTDENLPPIKNSGSKKKKKKKKSSQKSTPTVHNLSQNDSPEVLDTVGSDIAVAPTFILPVQPDEWFIQPATYTEAGEPVQEERFIYYKDGQEIVSLNFTEQNFAGLYTVLNERFGGEEFVPDRININAPLNEEVDPNPTLSFSRNGRLLTATQLDQKSMKQLVNSLNRYINRRPALNKSLGNWWLKHKIARVFVSILALPVVFLILYSFVWGMQH